MRRTHGLPAALAALGCAMALSSCGVAGHAAGRSTTATPSPHGAASATRNPPSPAGAAAYPGPTMLPKGSGPPAAKVPTAGNPHGGAAVPAAARAVDTSHPDHVIGSGTPGGCTSQAVKSAVSAGGIITFNCGPAPITITMSGMAKVRNLASRVVLDGGGRVTLSGGGRTRILLMNTCDRSLGYPGGDCNTVDHPRLTVQNLTMANGNATGQRVDDDGGGGAIWVHGGRLSVVNSRFTGNRCDGSGPDLGGAAIRVRYQEAVPAYLAGSTFTGGVCSNGGALSTLHASWAVLNSVLTGNSAIGHGANPAEPGTPGGGSGGAVYSDGNRFTGLIAGSIVQNNRANEGGGAVFFVSNDRTGTMAISGSTLTHDKSGGFETAGLPGIFFMGARKPTISGSTLR